MGLGRWIGFVGFLASLYILWRIQRLILLVFTAVVLATAINQGVEWLERLSARQSVVHIRRPLAVFLTIALLTGGMALFVALVVPPLSTSFNN